MAGKERDNEENNHRSFGRRVGGGTDRARRCDRETREPLERNLGGIILLPGTADCIDLEYDVYSGLVLRRPATDVAYVWNAGGTAYRAVPGADTRFCVRRAPAEVDPDRPAAAIGEGLADVFLGRPLGRPGHR